MRTKREAYIETRPGVRRGALVITGTSIKVLDVAVRYEAMSMTPEEIMVALPHLTLPKFTRPSPIIMHTNESSIGSGKLP
jgi:uncharacterized protein (DUF433 family)